MNTATDIPAEIVAIDFSELGSHWLRPDRSQFGPHELEQRPECHERLARFVKRYGVRPFRQRYRNLAALLKQGGAPEEAVKRVLVYYFGGRHQALSYCYGAAHAFDHPEMWGRDKTPLFLIGHPYQVDGGAIEALDAIRELGLSVDVDAASWYGFGTVQVCVCHWPTVRKLTEAGS
jgi:hypothetical protein